MPRQVILRNSGTAFARLRNQHLLLLLSPSLLKSPFGKKSLRQLRSQNRVSLIRFSGNFITEKEIKSIIRTLPNECTMILGIGGGAVMDLAKILKFHYLRQSQNSLQLWLCPSTGGTGSEATATATYYKNKTKHSLADPRLLPDHVLFIPSLLLSVPRMTRISTGADCFCQSIESILSKNATPTSIRNARKALKEIGRSWNSYVQKPSLSWAKGMQEGAHYSGRAIRETQTSFPHAASYELTRLHGLPHGWAVFLNLLPFLQYNEALKNTAMKKRLRIVFASVQAKNYMEFEERILKWCWVWRISLDFKDYGISDAQIRKIWRRSLSHPRAKNNLCELDPTGLEEILQRHIDKIRHR